MRKDCTKISKYVNGKYKEMNGKIEQDYKYKPLQHKNKKFNLVIESGIYKLRCTLPAGKGLTSWPSSVRCLLVFLSLSHMVAWISCDT